MFYKDSVNNSLIWNISVAYDWPVSSQTFLQMLPPFGENRKLAKTPGN